MNKNHFFSKFPPQGLEIREPPSLSVRTLAQVVNTCDLKCSDWKWYYIRQCFPTFFNHGTLTWNQSPAGTPLHFWHKFLNDRFSHLHKKFHLSNQIINLQHFGKCFHIGYSGRSVLRPICIENETFSLSVDNFIETS